MHAASLATMQYILSNCTIVVTVSFGQADNQALLLRVRDLKQENAMLSEQLHSLQAALELRGSAPATPDTELVRHTSLHFTLHESSSSELTF